MLLSNSEVNVLNNIDETFLPPQIKGRDLLNDFVIIEHGGQLYYCKEEGDRYIAEREKKEFEKIKVLTL